MWPGKSGKGEQPSQCEELRKAKVGLGHGSGGGVMRLGCSVGVSSAVHCQPVVRILTSPVFLFRKTQGWDQTALAGFQPKS